MSKPIPDERLMIFGASTRAAAQSAVRAGFRPLCADHFADEDLFEAAELLPISRYSRGLVAAAARSEKLVGQRPPSASLAHPTGTIPWIYTGALENHPRLLKKLAAIRPLYGNPAEVVARVRDPFRLARVLTNARLRVLEVCRKDQPPPRDGRFLIKPLRSAGGRGIQVWDASAVDPAHAKRREAWYFQERVEGEPHSAQYLATSVQTVLIGVSRQLVGESRLNAGPFAYCGSIGPIDVGEPLRREIRRFGEIIASEFGLRGLFGIDFVFDRHPHAWLTEVNPRYTASVEIFELALGIPLLRDHLLASASFDDPDRSRQVAQALESRLADVEHSRNGHTCGKAVIYAPFTLRAPQLADLMRQPAWADWRARIADRPRPGTIVPARAPLCTLLIDDLKSPPGRPEASLAAFEPALSTLMGQLLPLSAS